MTISDRNNATIERIVIAVASPIIVVIVLYLFTSIGSAASKSELTLSKKENYEYTDRSIRQHELKDEQRFIKLDENQKEIKSMVKYLYERQLNKK